MKARTFLLLLSFWLISLSLEAQSVVPWKYYPMLSWDTSPYKPYRFTSANNARPMNFRLLFPKNYDSTAVSNEKYPIILVLHGAGESALREWARGNALYPPGDPRIENNDHHLLFGAREHLNAVNSGKFNGFVLFPQNWNGTWIDGKGEAHSNYHIDLQMAVEMVEHLVTKLKIDPNRIYVWGLSNGGAGSWYAAFKRPDVFAATLPMSAPGYAPMASQLVELPAWVFQGETDTNPRPMFTKETIAAIENAGGTPRYTEYAATGHNTWGRAYNEPDFYSWMLSKNKLNIHAYYGKTEFPAGSSFTTTLGVSPGFNGYEWRHNGSSISGAITHKITISQFGDYQVRIKRGSNWSEWSPAIKITPTGTVSTPNAPSNLQASAASSSSINLSWTDNSGNEDNFRVYRSGSSSGSYSLVATLPANTSSWTNTGLSANTQYFYQVEAVNTAGSSARSNTASATTQQENPEGFTAPSNLVAQAVSNSQINLSWNDNSADETNFIMERGTTPDFSRSVATITLNANTTSYQDGNKTEGITFYYRIKAIKSGSETTWSNISSATPTSSNNNTAPTAPSNLQASAASSSSINLSWNDNSGNEDNFRVYRSASATGSYSLVATLGANTSSWTNTGLSANTQYFYQVEAVNTAGSSARSNTASATTQQTNTGGFAAPSNLTAQGVSTSQINLSWNDNSSDETNFILERSTSSTFSGSVARITLGANTTSYQDGYKTTGIVFYYRIKAIKSGAETAWSNVASAAATGNTNTAPNAPSNLQASAASSSSINLSWNDNSGNEDNFRVYRSASATGSYNLVATLGANTSSWTNTGLSASTQYFYQVEAVNAAGSSARSNTANATTQQTNTGGFTAPSNLTAQGVSSSQINLSWNDNTSDETNFILERAVNSAFSGSVARITLGANATSYKDGFKQAGVVYHYRVKAIKAGSESGWSNVVSATTLTATTANSAARSTGNENQIQAVAFPNKFKNDLKLEASVPEDEPADIVIYDMMGKTVFRDQMQLKQSASQLHIDFDKELPQGMYLLKIQGKHSLQSKTIKLLKE